MRNSGWYLAVRAALLGLTVASLVGCDGPAEARLSAPAKLVAFTPVNVSGVVGSEVSPGPGVLVVDKDGNPLAGVAVSFEKRDNTNGGVPVFTIVESDASGKARLATWKLGTIASQNLMIARLDSLPSVTFRALALTGPAAIMAAVDGDNQTGLPGHTLLVPVRVRVTDSFGNRIEEAEVTFSVQTGAGTIAPSPVTTNALGEARALWKLGVTGPNSVNASVPGLAGVTFTAVAGPELPPFPATYELREIRSGSVFLPPVLSQIVLDSDGTFYADVNEIQGSGTYTVEGTQISLKYAPGFWEAVRSETDFWPRTAAVSQAEEEGSIVDGTLTLVRCFMEDCHPFSWIYGRIVP